MMLIALLLTLFLSATSAALIIVRFWSRVVDDWSADQRRRHPPTGQQLVEEHRRRVRRYSDVLRSPDDSKDTRLEAASVTRGADGNRSKHPAVRLCDAVERPNTERLDISEVDDRARRRQKQ